MSVEVGEGEKRKCEWVEIARGYGNIERWLEMGNGWRGELGIMSEEQIFWDDKYTLVRQ